MTDKTKPESLFERLKASLEEGIRHLRGEVELKEYDIPAKPPAMESSAIIALRNRLDLSQAAFSCLLNVPVSTVALWEAGKRNPSGAAARLLQICSERPELVKLVTLTRNGQAAPPRKRRKAQPAKA